ncbi:hypothetical protein [Candidatus Aalborgicola defluviihabitans]
MAHRTNGFVLAAGIERFKKADHKPLQHRTLLIRAHAFGMVTGQ